MSTNAELLTLAIAHGMRVRIVLRSGGTRWQSESLVQMIEGVPKAFHSGADGRKIVTIEIRERVTYVASLDEIESVIGMT
jgi:hypothetical protein